jgi:hypothetical protein
MKLTNRGRAALHFNCDLGAVRPAALGIKLGVRFSTPENTPSGHGALQKKSRIGSGYMYTFEYTYPRYLGLFRSLASSGPKSMLRAARGGWSSTFVLSR